MFFNNSGGIGEPNKKAAKKNGHLTIYSLFKAIINVWLTF
jgi:hypothetical protein